MLYIINNVSTVSHVATMSSCNPYLCVCLVMLPVATPLVDWSSCTPASGLIWRLQHDSAKLTRPLSAPNCIFYDLVILRDRITHHLWIGYDLVIISHNYFQQFLMLVRPLHAKSWLYAIIYKGHMEDVCLTCWSWDWMSKQSWIQ